MFDPSRESCFLGSALAPRVFCQVLRRFSPLWTIRESWSPIGFSMELDSLLRRYRLERRKLLEFVLSAGLAAEVRPPPGAESLSDVDLDCVSADYVLDRVKSGGVLDLSKAGKSYQDELKFPVMISSRCGTKFFLNTKPEVSGAPPNRTPPQANKIFHHTSFATEQKYEGVSCKTPDEVHCTTTVLNNTSVISFGLPELATGLSDDELRETAYEVLVASTLVYGCFRGQNFFHEVKQKEKKLRILTGLRSRRERMRAETKFMDWHSEVMDMIRVQMEISETMDTCIKRGLTLFQPRLIEDHLDVPLITLELLSNVNKSDFVNEKLFKQWQLKQGNVLKELLSGPVNVFMNDEYAELELSTTAFKSISERNGKSGSDDLAENLMIMIKIASKVSRIPKKFGLSGETCYWTSSYHCHIRLYEKLLRSVFDILEDGQIVEESEEFLSVFKLTWPVLGITQKLHDVLYSFVLFQQYVWTGETMLLRNAVSQIQKAISSEYSSRNEEAYMNCLLCFNGTNEGDGELGLVQAVLSSIKTWCEKKLQDYHLHFTQKPEHFESIANLAVVLTHYLGGEDFESEFGMDVTKSKQTPKIIKGYIENSISAACGRVVESSGGKSKLEVSHHLVKLSEDLKLTADTESTTFTPVLRQWYPEAGVVSAVLLHKHYGEYLMPFLETVSDFSGSSRLVLTASAVFEKCLNDMIYSCNEESVSNLVHDLQPYKIGMISRPLILQWVNAQHDNLLKWAQRAILIESWEPLSAQQRLAVSIVEVFRIIEENVDQFFGFQLPMDIIHLRSLLIGIFQSLDTYLMQMGSNFVDKKHFYPSLSALTRYKEEKGLFAKKKPTEQAIMDENFSQSLDSLTTSKLCIRLNTLRYIRLQIDLVEESIKKLWSQIHPDDKYSGDANGGSDSSAESIEELFTIFDEIRKTSFSMNDMICDFIGTRVIFWDLRDPIILSLYSGDVEHARLDVVIQQLDSILNQICDLVTDTLRDQVISSICKASMEAFVWVLLDGGPSRAFSQEDTPMLQEDLSLLKELFVASGDGLPGSVVEKESKLLQQILEICSLKTGTIIEMMMSSSEHINPKSDIVEPDKRQATDPGTLLRILCHRKEREASKFLKKHYHLPKSSDYGKSPGKNEIVSKSPGIGGILMGSRSGRWTEKGQRSFRSMKQRFQEAASEIRYSSHW